MPVPAPQPIKGVLAMRRITNKRAAEAIGVHPVSLARFVNGFQEPGSRIRKALAAFLGVPASTLFRPEEPRVEPRGRKARA